MEKIGYIITTFNSYSQTIIPRASLGVYTSLESVIKILKTLNKDYIEEDMKFFEGALTVEELIQEKYIGNTNCLSLIGGEFGAMEIYIYD